MCLKYRFLIIIIAILFAILTSNTFGQDIIWRNSIGLFGGGNFNLHSPSMTPTFTVSSPSSTIKVNFDEGNNSFSGFGGIEANFQLATIFVLTGKVSYDFTGADFSKRTNNSTNNTLNTKLNYLYLAPMFKLVNLLPFSKPIYFTTGVNFGIPIISSYDFEQKVNSRPRPQSGDILEPNLRISLPIGIGYIYKLSENFSIIPEISYHLPFSEVSSNTAWQQWDFQQIKAGISVTYMLPKSSKKEKKILEKTPPSILEPSIKQINYVDRTGKHLPLNGIQLEEVEFGEYFPLIPYIFYEVNDTELDRNYKHHKKSIISASGLNSYKDNKDNMTNAIDVHYKSLDIIGKRMESTPNANLIIIGTIDGKVETEKEISLFRALGVKKYLVSNFKIDSNRIAVRYGSTPSKPSAQTVKDGVVENRRVELYSNNPAIFEPYFVLGEQQRIAYPDIIEFTPAVRSYRQVVAWDMEIFHADRLIKKISGDVVSKDNKNSQKYDDSVNSAVEKRKKIGTETKNNKTDNKTNNKEINNDLPLIRINFAMNELSPSQVPIEYKYSVYTDDSAASVTGSIPIDFFSSERKKSISQKDRVVTKYSLVLFDFDSAEISEQNKSIIDKFVIPNIKYGSTVDIYGFSDRIGQPEYNKRLSIQRAISTRDYILTKNKNVPIKADGLGVEAELFDNDLAIGRQLSRTVQIFVFSPK